MLRRCVRSASGRNLALRLCTSANLFFRLWPVSDLSNKRRLVRSWDSADVMAKTYDVRFRP